MTVCTHIFTKLVIVHQHVSSYWYNNNIIEQKQLSPDFHDVIGMGHGNEISPKH